MNIDRRRVLTAVTGRPDSDEPAFMPIETDEAEEFRDQARELGQTHWCGLLLGGCGGQLSLKIVRERETVPHFAHRADSNLCARMDKGREDIRGGQSADHLYAHRHLRTWMRSRERPVEARPEFVGLAQGRACTELIVPTGGKPLRLVFTHDLDHDLVDLAKSTAARDYVWLVRTNDSVTRALVANHVPYRRFRLTFDSEGSRALQVGFRDSAGQLQWVPLEECVLRVSTLERMAQAPVEHRPAHHPDRDDVAESLDPLEQAMGSLRKVTAQDGADPANVRAMIDVVRVRLRAAQSRGVDRHILTEARALLEEANAMLPARKPVRELRPMRAALPRQGGARTVRPQEHLHQEADMHLGKLQWAQDRRLSRAYDDNRAALVKMLNRSNLPKAVGDQIRQQLAKSPKGLFASPAPTPIPQNPRPAPRPRRSPTARSAKGAGRVHAQVQKMLDTLRWAQKAKRPDSYGHSRAQLTEALGRPSTPQGLKKEIEQQLLRSPEGLFDRPIPVPAPPQKRTEPPERRRGRRPSSQGRPSPTGRTPSAASDPGGGLLANARMDERSRRLLEELQASPQTAEKPPKRG